MGKRTDRRFVGLGPSDKVDADGVVLPSSPEGPVIPARKGNGNVFHAAAASDGRGGDRMKIYDEQGKEVSFSEVGGTGIHIDGVHQTEADLARIKTENPELHSELQRMRGTLVGTGAKEAGASRRVVVGATVKAGGDEGDVVKTDEQEKAPTVKPGFRLKNIHLNLAEAHRILSDHINTLRTHAHRDETGVLSSLLDVAGGSVDAVGKHLDRANSAMRGYKIHNAETGESKFFTQQHEAPKHMDKALRLLSDAHDIMSSPFIGHITGATNTSAGDASGNLDYAEEGLQKARRKRGARPWKTTNIAGTPMPTGVLLNPNNSSDMKLVKDAQGMLNNMLGDKVRRAQAGTPRGQRAGSDRPDKPAGQGRRESKYRGSSRIKGPGE